MTSFIARSLGTTPVRRLRAFWLGETDLAGVAAFRAIYGALLVIWLLQLLPYLREFFTDEGLLPRRTLFLGWSDRFSLLNAFPEWWQVFGFWLLAFAAAVCVMVGYRTRLAVAISFIALTSFQWRNPVIMDGSDQIFRLLSFWLIFTRCGERYSIDAVARRARGDVPTGRGPALPVRIIELQVAWLYLSTALEKLPGSTWFAGTAFSYALQLTSTWARPMADGIARVDWLSKIASWWTIAVELAVLPAVFSPVRNRLARVGISLAIAPLHIGIMTLMTVGNFPSIMLATLVLFVPPDLVERSIALGARVFRRSVVRLYYDGACHFCRRTVAYLTAMDLYRTVVAVDFRGAEVPGLGRAELEKRIHVVDDRGRVTRGFAAVARASHGIPLLAPLALLNLVPPLAALAERLYDVVAARRLFLLSCPGESCDLHESASAPKVARPRAALGPRRSAALAAIATAAFSTSLAQTTLALRTPEAVRRPLAVLTIDQRWNMFSPDPPKVDGWMFAPAWFSDGSRVDLVTGGPPATEPGASELLSSRWKKAIQTVAYGGYSEYRLEFARMYCRLVNWHLEPGQPALQYFELRFQERDVALPGTAAGPPRDYMLWWQQCY